MSIRSNGTDRGDAAEARLRGRRGLALIVDAPSAEAFFDEQMRTNGFTYLPIAREQREERAE